MVMVAAGRDERGFRAVALHEVEAEHTAIEAECAIEVRDFEVHVADSSAGVDGARGFLSHQGSLRRRRAELQARIIETHGLT